MIETIRQALTGPDLAVIAVLGVLDVILGIIASLKDGTFELKKVANYLMTNFGVYFLLYGAFKVVISLYPEWSFIGPIVFVTVIAALVGSINENLKPWGVSIPSPFDRTRTL